MDIIKIVPNALFKNVALSSCSKSCPGDEVGIQNLQNEEKFPVLPKLFPVSCLESFLVALFF